ncbi:zinc finger protein OZF-like isoform X1 [Daphnia pulicaria]|uniref:zinc finger protein OZF-like isoform X1 n=1 Tax=Daphnia pulicaria TaxID=35523 RepID=UPI001EECE3D0|nr:zinc finger protein OZF-like isoform X1 [Daphnia pulicaria]
MGSCEGLEILGVLKTAQEGKQMVLQLKPSIETTWEHCGFCDFKLDSDIDKLQSSRETEHSHAIQGVFSFIPSKNQWTLTFSNCDKEERHQHVGKPSSTCEVIKNDITINRQKNLQLQYEVDGKVFELRSTFSAKKHRNVEPSNNNFATSNKSITQPTKAIEFVIENNKYSTSSVNTKAFEEAVVVEEERSALEASLELLQVKLMDKCIVPDQIGCGPDTSTFLQNMRELAKLLTPSGQNPFKCDQCEEEMTSYFPYVEHVFKHFGTRPYICNVCQASFQTRAVMRHHLDMHGGKAPFECEFCGKKFRNSCHMKQHRMRHTGERPHNCPYCEKTFAHKNVLKIHLQVHTGEKPCCCDLCGKLFREPHRLACHLATHYRSSKSLDCSACGKSFKTSGMLKLHEAKRCSNKLTTDLERDTEDQGLETLQNVAYIENIDDAHFLDTDHEVTIIEAESLEVLPVNTYIVEPSGVGPMLVQFSIDQDDVQEIPSLEESLNS